MKWIEKKEKKKSKERKMNQKFQQSSCVWVVYKCILCTFVVNQWCKIKETKNFTKLKKKLNQEKKRSVLLLLMLLEKKSPQKNDIILLCEEQKIWNQNGEKKSNKQKIDGG